MHGPDWVGYFSNFLLLAAAFLIALPIGWERRHDSRTVGLRTMPLVAVASCGYMLIAVEIVGPYAEPLARVMHGLMTGIGFIGGGAILKSGGAVHGTATAASIWTMGGIGMAVAFKRFEIAFSLLLLNFLILHTISRPKQEA